MLFQSFDKKHFSKKLEGIKRKILDVEFLRDQYRLTREGFRVEYDRLRELQDAATVRIGTEKQKEDPDKTIIEELTKLKERYDPDCEQLKKQMEQMDLLVEGPAPEGSANQPLNVVLDNLRQVERLLEDKLKTL